MDKKSMYNALRATLRHQVLNLLGLGAKPAPGIHILNGHRMAQEREPDTFRQLLTALVQEGVRLVSIEEAVAMIERGERPDVCVVAFTFDDGFMECYDVFAPLLQEFGVNALFFVNPNYVAGNDAYVNWFNQHCVDTPGKRPMRWHHLRQLASQGFVIGAHTMDHRLMAAQSEDACRYQVVQCKDVIEQALGRACHDFAFPYGKLTDVDESTIALACATYKHVFSQSDHRHYHSFQGRVINRRHFEPFWPVSHVNYFLSVHKK